jgi:hypothetical protein
LQRRVFAVIVAVPCWYSASMVAKALPPGPIVVTAGRSPPLIITVQPGFPVPVAQVPSATAAERAAKVDLFTLGTLLVHSV